MQNDWIPLAGRILAKRVDDIHSTKGGIFIPETAKEKQSEGTVTAVGVDRTTPEGKVIPSQVKVGDRIVFGKYAGVEVTLDGEVYLTMKEEEVLMRKEQENVLTN